jgi:transcriptional regulator with XRE-family HTH domain
VLHSCGVPSRSPQADRSHEALGLAIRQARVEQKLTQYELAHQTNLHPTQISSIEGGNRNPTYRALRQISRGLGLRLSQLIALAEELERQQGR